MINFSKDLIRGSMVVANASYPGNIPFDSEYQSFEGLEYPFCNYR